MSIQSLIEWVAENKDDVEVKVRWDGSEYCASFRLLEGLSLEELQEIASVAGVPSSAVHITPGMPVAGMSTAYWLVLDIAMPAGPVDEGHEEEEEDNGYGRASGLLVGNKLGDPEPQNLSWAPIQRIGNPKCSMRIQDLNHCDAEELREVAREYTSMEARVTVLYNQEVIVVGVSRYAGDPPYNFHAGKILAVVQRLVKGGGGTKWIAQAAFPPGCLGLAITTIREALIRRSKVWTQECQDAGK